MGKISNEFKMTGISGINVSWRQDVLPLLSKLQKKGLALDVHRRKVVATKGFSYMYDVLTDDTGTEDRVYFRTNSLAAVWTYLLGITESRERLPQLPKRNEKVCVIPSESYLNDLIGRSVLGNITDKERKLLRWYSDMVQEAYDTGVLEMYHGPTNWGRWVKDVQTALLNSGNTNAWMEWIEKHGNDR